MNASIGSRRDFLKATGLGAVSLALPSWLNAGQPNAALWQVGYAQADITPQPGQCMMAGYGRERYAAGTLSPLMMQVLAIRDPKQHTALLITADILAFDRVTVEAIRHQIAKKHGIAAERIMFAASHTHWAPAVTMYISYAIGSPNVWYMAHLEESILAQVDKALQDFSPAVLEYTATDCRSVGFCRRLPVNGKITWGPYPQGSYDSHTPILRIMRNKSPRQIIAVGHACHPTSSGSIEKWSPDYPGAMRQTITEQLAETGRLVFSASPERARQGGVKLAHAVLKHLAEGKKTVLTEPIACSLATGPLSFGKVWDRREIEDIAYNGSRKDYLTWTARQYLALPIEKESFRYDVQLWRFGRQLTIFGMEGEICSPWGPMLRAMARTEHSMVIGYANNTSAYIPDKRIVREGGYEGFSSHRVYFQPGPFTEAINQEVKAIAARALDAGGASPQCFINRETSEYQGRGLYSRNRKSRDAMTCLAFSKMSSFLLS